MSVGKGTSGFTIIEVLLVLAITAILFTIAIIGFGSTTADVQSNDSMRALQSMVQSHYNQLFTGANLEGAVAPTGNEIIIGRLFEFNAGGDPQDFLIHQVVGDRLSGNELNGNDIDLISASNPRLSPQTLGSSLDWQTEFVEGQNNGNPGNDVFGFIRSPGSSNVYAIVIPATETFADNSTGTYDLSGTSFLGRGEVDARFCYQTINGQNAALFFGGAQANNAVDIEFRTANCP